MEKKQFKEFLKKYFHQHGFEKIKNRFYRNGEGFLCEIDIGKSYYDDVYYFDYNFYIGDFSKPYAIDRGGWQTHTPYVGQRFFFSENNACSCSYLKYEEEKLVVDLDENMKKAIFPPFDIGKEYLLNNFGTLYTTFLDEEQIRKLLSE